MKSLIEIETKIDETQEEIKRLLSLPNNQEPAVLQIRYKNLHDLNYALQGLQEEYEELRSSIQDVQMDVLNASEKLSDENEIIE